MKKTNRETELDPSINHFIDSIWAHKGLAALTLSAYQQDLKQFSSWLIAVNKELTWAEKIDIQSLRWPLEYLIEVVFLSLF